MALSLPEELKRLGDIDAPSVHAVAQSPALRGRQFALRLFQSGLVSAERIFDALVSLGARDATDRLDPPPSARLLALVPSRFAEQGCMVPFRRAGKRLPPRRFQSDIRH